MGMVGAVGLETQSNIFYLYLALTVSIRQRWLEVSLSFGLSIPSLHVNANLLHLFLTTLRLDQLGGKQPL